MESVLNDSADQVANEIIIRLNGIKDANYASKVSYDTFKTLLRIHERKFHKDIHETLEVLNPILKVLDAIVIELHKKQDIMNRGVQNSFMMAYGESTYFEMMAGLNEPDLEHAIDLLSKYSSHDKTTLLERLLTTTDEIKNYGIFDSTNQQYSDVFYSLTAAKRKIERELDWALCSIDKQIFPLMKKITIQETGKVTSIMNPSQYVTMYDQDSTELVNLLDKKLTAYADNNQWKKSEHLSLIIKNNSKVNNALYLDSRSIPDANDLDKVFQIPKLCTTNRIVPKELAKKMGVKPRMASYYLDAAEMLGVVERDGKFFKPTDLVDKLENYVKEDREEIVRRIVKDLPVVKALLLYLEQNSKTRFTTQDVTKFLKYATDLSPTTAIRRASTIYSWLNRKRAVKHQNEHMLVRSDSSQTTLGQYL